MSCARVCPYKSVGRYFETNIGIRLQARRCDCSFVLAAPVQTSVGKFNPSSSCGKVGARQRFQAAGVFSARTYTGIAFAVGR
jgi:hypothetical protein